MALNYDEIVGKYEKYIFQTYTRQPIAIKEAHGAVVVDVDGKEYIDCVAGIAVNNVALPSCSSGCNKKAGRAVNSCLEPVLYRKPGSSCRRTCRPFRHGSCLYCNSGAEAVEGALKLARKASGKKEFIATEHAFHGRTRVLFP